MPYDARGLRSELLARVSNPYDEGSWWRRTSAEIALEVIARDLGDDAPPTVEILLLGGGWCAEWTLGPYIASLRSIGEDLGRWHVVDTETGDHAGATLAMDLRGVAWVVQCIRELLEATEKR